MQSGIKIIVLKSEQREELEGEVNMEAALITSSVIAVFFLGFVLGFMMGKIAQ